MTEIESILINIHKDFFIYRNGIVADNLRKIYPSEVVIFGLTVAQFNELSQKYPHTLDLGLKLWNHKKDRESRLMALYLLPVKEIDKTLAKEMLMDVRSIEEADFLCFKILRHLPFAEELYTELNLIDNKRRILEYTLGMLKKNLDQI